MRKLLTVAAVVLGVAAALLAVHRVDGVRDRAQEVRWLAAHSQPGSYRVVELGEPRADGSAGAVWVQQAGAPNAFVDLTGSSQEVRAVGVEVAARLDNRQAPALGTGVAEDALHRSFTRDYLTAGTPALPALVCLAGLVLLRRRPQARRPRSHGGSAREVSVGSG